jgi:hypothetical protein
MEYLYNPLATKLIRNIERMMFVEQIGERVLTKTQRRFINYVMAGSRSLPAITLNDTNTGKYYKLGVFYF